MTDLQYNEENIQVLKGLEPVRMRPGMFIGDTDIKGFHHLFNEIIDNSIDEAMAGRCDEISVSLLEPNVIQVEDNGVGIPVGIHPVEGRCTLEVVMTVLHAGGKFGGGGYKVSGGLHGVGMSCVNALSEWFISDVYREGYHWRMRFERGMPFPLEQLEATDKHGTKQTFKPDYEIFQGDFHFHPETITGRLRELAYLNKNVKIIFNNALTNEQEVFHFTGGIVQFVEKLNTLKDPLHKPLYVSRERNDVQVELALQYNDGYQEILFAYANNIHTVDGGTHVSGFRTALTRVLNAYARKNGLLKEKDASFVGDDVREGLTAVISVKLPNPQFESQTKVKLKNAEIDGIVNSIAGEAMSDFLEENPAVARKIIEKALTASRARAAARRAMELERKSVLETSTSLPGKLADCHSKDAAESELFLVEGDSAGGSAKKARNSKFQAVLPLRGVVLNVERARLDKILNNNEIADMIRAIGVGICTNGGIEPVEEGCEDDSAGNGTFNLEKRRYDRIIIMTDADVDGAHIRTLLLTLFFRYMQPLVEGGHVYIAQPPLFGVKQGKEIKYAMTEQELEEIMKDMPKRGLQVMRYKGLGEMDADELAETAMDPTTRRLVRIELEDAVEANEIFTTLMGDAVGPRKDFITRHAKQVSYLDI